MLVNVVMLAYQTNVQIYPLDVKLSGEEIQQFNRYLLNLDPDDGIVKKVLYRVFSLGNQTQRPYGDLFCSVSAGDIVLLGSERWLCARMGWKKLTVEEMYSYCNLDHAGRLSSKLLDSYES